MAVYQDDGFTGLNMERPDLKRDAQSHRAQANQPLSSRERFIYRLGRNYLQTGTLIEDFFPRHGVVRYIAMNDGIDTMRENNDIAVQEHPQRDVQQGYFQRKSIPLIF